MARIEEKNDLCSWTSNLFNLPSFWCKQQCKIEEYCVYKVKVVHL